MSGVHDYKIAAVSKPEFDEDRAVLMDEDATPVLRGPNGAPLTEGVFEYLGLNAVHLYKTCRLACRFKHVDSGTVLIRYYRAHCACKNLFPNNPCNTWWPKGWRGSLGRDAAVMYGRELRKGDRIDPGHIFRGRLVRAKILVGNKDGEHRALPEACHYSKLGAIVALEAGDRPGKR